MRQVLGFPHFLTGWVHAIRNRLSTYLEVIGLLAVVVGVAFVWWPASIIVFGVLTVGYSYLMGITRSGES